jgi:hypothetical protein
VDVCYYERTERLDDDTNALKEKISEDYLHVLIEYIENIKYGSVTVSIQDGKVVLIEKTEKLKTR